MVNSAGGPISFSGSPVLPRELPAAAAPPAAAPPAAAPPAAAAGGLPSPPTAVSPGFVLFFLFAASNASSLENGLYAGAAVDAVVDESVDELPD